MDIVFKDYFENSEVPRKEITFTISFNGAIPSKKAVISEIMLCYGATEDLVALDSFRSIKGKGLINGSARIYQTAADLKRCERKH